MDEKRRADRGASSPRSSPVGRNGSSGPLLAMETARGPRGVRQVAETIAAFGLAAATPRPRPRASASRILASVRARRSAGAQGVLVLDMIKEHLTPGQAARGPSRARHRARAAASASTPRARAGSRSSTWLTSTTPATRTSTASKGGGHTRSAGAKGPTYGRRSRRTRATTSSRRRPTARSPARSSDGARRLEVDTIVLTGCLTEIGDPRDGDGGAPARLRGRGPRRLAGRGERDGRARRPRACLGSCRRTARAARATRSRAAAR